ncbi:MAG: site-specific integrase [Candidatus Paceibacterota bacterium]
MSITINLVQLKRKQKKNGEIPIYFRFTENGLSKYLSTGISVDSKDWNASRQEIRKSHERCNVLNHELQRQLNKAKDKKLELNREDRLTIPKLKSYIKHKGTKGIFDYAEEYLAMLKEEKRYSEWKHFKVIINQIETFLKGKNIEVKKIEQVSIEKFQFYLLNEVGNNPNTTRKKLSQLRGLFKYLIKDKVIDKDPFINLEKVSPSPVRKTRLTKMQIDAIRILELKPYTNLWHIRNYFLYSYYNAGIRFSDLCTLTWENLVGGRLYYRMGKTNREKNIHQFDVMKKITDLYRTKDCSKDDYMFPILKKKYKDEFSLKRAISSKNTLVNRDLKKLAKFAGIEENVSFHISRHSFSQNALKEGLSLYAISKALGHRSLEVTQAYLNDFDEDLLDIEMDKFFAN